ncbi:DUF4288 domain-containing protein [Nocardia sp. NPDC049707]|uniref:DUF4288 domain-containing protein n=1 Tax=Nocardia sp. NPDC049707 TaxID=3154735 RepID=UPI00342AD33A
MVERSLFVAVVVYQSTSDAPDYRSLYQEDFVLIHSESEEMARQRALEIAKEQECVYRNEKGENITVAFKCLVDVSPAIDDELSNDAVLYTRHFRDYESYRRMEPLLDDNPL